MTNPEPTIIFEDNQILVIDKPAGLSVHSDSEDPANTVVAWFLNRVPDARGVGEPRLGKDGKEIERSGVVHRLDRDTSGVMVLAKTQEAFDSLKSQFLTRSIRKEYRALVYGAMKERWGTINRPIGRSSKDWRLRSAERGSRGHRREAVTEWECLKAGQYNEEPFSYLKLRPKTGRTHQLRVHLRSIGRPIVGDGLYAGQTGEESNNLGLNRMALHSISLTITLLSGEGQTFEAPLPSELASAIELIV